MKPDVALRSRRRASWAVAAGMAFGIAVLVRPAGLLLLIPLALALPPRPRSYFLFLLGFWAAYETWWYTRFLLPAIPALLLASLLAARNALYPGEEGGSVPLRRVLSVVAFAVVVAFEAYVIRDRGVLRAAEGDKVFAGK